MKILVVDDEPLARERLLRLLGRLQPGAVCLQAGDGLQALQLVAQEVPDLVLLDIRMPGMDGIAVAGELGKMDEPPAVVFCTAYDEHALEALQHQVVAYLLKPVRESDLVRALDNARRVNRLQLAQLQEAVEAGDAAGRSYITSQSHRGLESIALADVRCFMAEDKYVTAYGPDCSLVIEDSLKDLEQEFGARFVRVHRNALIALQHVVNMHRGDGGVWVLELDGIPVLPQVSRRHLREVKALLQAR